MALLKPLRLCCLVMNKFSSMSTGVLLALLTSSVSAAAYADGTANLSARTNARPVADANKKEDGNDDNNKSANAEGIRASGAIAMDRCTHTIDLRRNYSNAVEAMAAIDENGATTDPAAPVAISASPDNTEEASSAASDAAEVSQHHSPIISSYARSMGPVLRSKGATDAVASNEADDDTAGVTTAAATDDADAAVDLSGKPLRPSVFDPDAQAEEVMISFDYPHEFDESFIVAGDSTVISYSSEDSNLLITLKLTPLDDLALGYEEFRKRITARFSDQEKMLYGEYEVLNEVKNTQEAIGLQKTNPEYRSINPKDHYMELSLRAYLKKGSDGILPDMQNYFYERNILSNHYLATMSCELQGRQSSVAIVKDQFESLSPLCERILKSYSFSFKTSDKVAQHNPSK